MTEEKALRQFVIRRFIAILLIVGVLEFLIIDIVNYILIPTMGDLFFPQLSDLRDLSFGNILFVAVLLLLYLISLLLNNIIPASSWFVNIISNQLGIGGTGNAGNPLKDLSSFQTIMLAVTFISALVLAAVPFICGAYIFARKVAKKFKVLEEARLAERREADRNRYLMISDIAHDLKTPMTTVSGYARALSDGVVKKGQEQEYLNAITSKTERMNDIVQMLFNYVRLDSEGFKLVRSRTDLCELVRECISSVYQDIEDKGDEVNIDIPESVVSVSVDKIQFSRVISNLLTNAVKHNPSGTVITVCVRREYDDIRVFVADNGVIIPPELAGQIFDPFVMGDASRGTGGGSGLGLSVAKKIVEMHGFKIKLVQGNEVSRYRLGEEVKKAFVIVMAG